MLRSRAASYGCKSFNPHEDMNCIWTLFWAGQEGLISSLQKLERLATVWASAKVIAYLMLAKSRSYEEAKAPPGPSKQLSI